MDSILFLNIRIHFAILFVLCVLSMASFAFAGNMFMFDFDKEFSLPSLYHYVLIFICCLGFFRLKQLETVYDVWFYAFSYLLLDDVLALHETAGKLLAEYVIPSEFWFFTKRALGETSYLAVVGGLVGIFLAKRFFDASAATRKQFVIFFVLMLCLGLFGVLADSIHERVCQTRALLCFCMGIVEDGGEVFVTIIIIHQIRKLLINSTRRISPGSSPGSPS